MFNRVTLIGCGLIGSSIARAIRQKGGAKQIAVIERSDILDRVTAQGFADHVTDQYDIIAQSDLVIICTPLGAYDSIGEKMKPYLAPGTIVTDVGSVKAAAVQSLLPHLPDAIHFIPGHPIAGTENSGPESGFAELFHDRWWLLTPLDNDAADYQSAVRNLQEFYTGFGCKVSAMPAGHHDQVLAMTSHLPHLIAYSIVDTCVKLEQSMQQEVIAFSASGFRDFTRIAASDPTMWRDIFLNNRDAVLKGLQFFMDDLTALQTAIKDSDGDTLFDVFTRTRAVRRSIVDQRQHVPEENKKKI